MNGNDARIVRLFTARSGGLVEDDTPNASSPRATRFDLILQAEAGGILGDSGANYTLTIIAVNDDAVRPEARLDPAEGPFHEEWSLDHGWRPSGDDFVKTGPGEPDGVVRYRITVPDGLNGAFHYNARLVSANFQVTSFARSNPFILV